MPVIAQRILPDGREAILFPLTYGRSRICVGEAGSAFFDDSW